MSFTWWSCSRTGRLILPTQIAPIRMRATRSSASCSQRIPSGMTARLCTPIANHNRLASALEPFLQFPDLQVLPGLVKAIAALVYFRLNFTQAAFFRRYGFLAAILVWVGFL